MAGLERAESTEEGKGRPGDPVREKGCEERGVWSREAGALQWPAGPAPPEWRGEERRAARPPAGTWGPARHLPLGRP